MVRWENEGLSFQVSSRMQELGIKHGFTDRLGGVSEGIYASLNLGINRGDDRKNVEENYNRVCRTLGVDREKLVFSGQVHGDVIHSVELDDIGKGLNQTVDYDADGLITNIPEVTLVVFGADCLTILLCDPVKQVVAAVHAGWRGTALGITAKTVEKMVKEYGCDRENILAALGPCISKCCFETGEEVPKAMAEALGAEAVPYIEELGDGKFKVDLKGLNLLWLNRSGVLATNVDVSKDCTKCYPERYWSHRYTHGERGTQAALISLCRREGTAE